MPKQTSADDYELRDEYDLARMTVVTRGGTRLNDGGKNVVRWLQMWRKHFPPMMPSTKHYG